MTALFAERALLPSGWARDVRLEIAADGDLASVTADAGAGGAERLAGPAVPGMPNLHGHAFQRAMAGLAERAGPSDDSFRTWRQVMYGFVRSLSPDAVEAIAAQLYVEMLKDGLHRRQRIPLPAPRPRRQPLRRPSGNVAPGVVAAAQAASIGITHLPVLYAHGGFGGAPASPGQRRFLHGARWISWRWSRPCSRATRATVRCASASRSSSHARSITPEAASAKRSTRSTPGQPVHIHIGRVSDARSTTAWRGAARGRSNGCWRTPRSRAAGAWCTPLT